MAATYRLTPLRRAGNVAVRSFVHLGIGDRNTYLLTVPGRKSGRRYSTPVILTELDGRRYLVSPYGEREWVKNARAAGTVELSRGRRSERPVIVEVGPEESAPVPAGVRAASPDHALVLRRHAGVPARGLRRRGASPPRLPARRPGVR